MRSWPDKDLWQRAGKKSGIFAKKSEKSPFYGGTCFFTRRGRDSGVAASRWWMREKERELTIDDLQLTIERQRDAAPSAARSHRPLHKWYKDYRNSWLRRLANVPSLLLNPFNFPIVVIPLQSAAGAPDDYRLWGEPQGRGRKISRTREKRWSKMATYCKCIAYSFRQPENRVPVAYKQVLVSHLPVLMSRLPVPVTSRQVLMRYEFTQMPAFCRLFASFLRGGHPWPPPPELAA